MLMFCFVNHCSVSESKNICFGIRLLLTVIPLLTLKFVEKHLVTLMIHVVRCLSLIVY